MASGKTYLQQTGLQATLMAAVVVAMLLVTGGIEMNPGPVGAMSWEDIEKIREIVREACQAKQMRELIREQNDEMREIKDCVKEELRIITGKVVENSGEVDLVKTKMKELEEELNHVKWQQKMSIEEAKRKNIFIYGTAENEKEDPYELLSKVLDILNNHCTQEDIDEVYRLVRVKGKRPIKVKLVSALKANKAILNAKNLKGERIWVKKEMDQETIMEQQGLRFHLRKPRNSGLMAYIRGKCLIVGDGKWLQTWMITQVKEMDKQVS